MFVVVVYLNPSLPPTLPPTLAASNAICRLCKAAEIQTVSQTVQVNNAIIFDDSSVYNLPLSLVATEAVEICRSCKWPPAKAS